MKLSTWVACGALAALRIITACGGGSDAARTGSASGIGGTGGAVGESGASAETAGDETGGGGAAGSSGADDEGGALAEAGAAGALSTAPLTLVSRTPDADADDVWFYDPIVLVFLEALDQRTLEAENITVLVDGKAVTTTLDLSASGTTVTVNVTAPPPSLPASVTIDISAKLTAKSGHTFAGASWSWRLPVWQTPGSPPSADRIATLPAIAIGANNQPAVAWLGGLTAPNPITVASFDGSAWHTLGGPPNQNAGVLASSLSMVFSGGKDPVVAWSEMQAGTPSVFVSRWNGKAWALLGGNALGENGSTDPVSAVDSNGQVLVAFRESASRIVVDRWTGTAWAAAGAALDLQSGTVGPFSLSAAGTVPVIAYLDAQFNVAVVTLPPSGATPIGPTIERVSMTANSSRPALTVDADGTVYVAYVDGEGTASNLYVSRHAAADLGWVQLGHALDLKLDGTIDSPVLAVGADERVHAAWQETYAGVSKVYVARFSDNAWTFLESALSSSAQPLVPSVAMVLDGNGNPTLAFQQQSSVFIKRFNGSPELPFGLEPRASTAACAITQADPASDADLPKTLTATGCYSNVAAHQIIAGAIPYELNSPLWSDGATKFRYLVLPEGKTIGYSTGDTKDQKPVSWQMPVGTIIVKEFWYEKVVGDPTGIFPMETRFLVKRCEDGDCNTPWQGYSYQWTDAGTEATLLGAAEPDAQPDTGSTKAWSASVGGIAVMHTQTYPARTQCLRCHNTSVGYVLGIQTPNLNRVTDYGSAIDNQLRALDHIGAFGTTFPDAGPTAALRLPVPADPSFSLAERARAYLHTNCSHCHNIDGEQETIDFQFYGTGLTASNLCNKLVPGDPMASKIYRKDAHRDSMTEADDPGFTALAFGHQMPPIATLIPDTNQLPITKAWITGMAACP